MNETQTHRYDIEVRTYAYLHLAAENCLNRARSRNQENNLQELLDCMECITLTAFFVEAYINHLGAETFSFWDKLKPSLRTRDKLIILADEYDVEIDFGCGYGQAFSDVFKLRNDLAHGVTHVVSEKRDGPISVTKDEHMIARWQKDCNLSKCERFLEMMSSLVKLFYNATEGGDGPFGTLVNMNIYPEN